MVVPPKIHTFGFSTKHKILEVSQQIVKKTGEGEECEDQEGADRLCGGDLWLHRLHGRLSYLINNGFHI